MRSPVSNTAVTGIDGVEDPRKGFVGALTVKHGAWYGLSTTMHASLPSGVHSRLQPCTQFSQRLFAAHSRPTGREREN